MSLNGSEDDAQSVPQIDIEEDIRTAYDWFTDRLPDDFEHVIEEFSLFDQRGDGDGSPSPSDLVYTDPDTPAFNVRMRVNFQNEAEINSWKTKFEELSYCRYQFRSSKGPNGNNRRFSYSKDFVCHHSNYNKQVRHDDPKIDKSTDWKYKATDCNSKMYIRLKNNTKYVCYRDPYSAKGFLGVVRLSFTHNHSISEHFFYHRRKKSKESKGACLESATDSFEVDDTEGGALQDEQPVKEHPSSPQNTIANAERSDEVERLCGNISTYLTSMCRKEPSELVVLLLTKLERKMEIGCKSSDPATFLQRLHSGIPTKPRTDKTLSVEGVKGGSKRKARNRMHESPSRKRAAGDNRVYPHGARRINNVLVQNIAP